jgi:DNA gyrase subunit A
MPTMPEHWRLGTVERSVLETLVEANALPNRPHRKCANLVGRMQSEHGIADRYTYDALSTMAKPWLLHLPLIDFHGNNGSLDPDDKPAAARYTESRLARAGVLALAAEQGTGPKVPLALINGDLHFDGHQPPYSPARVVATLLALIDEPSLSDSELVERIGPPETPTGCAVTCDHRGLAAGAAVNMVQTAHVTLEEETGSPRITLTNYPLGIGSETICETIAARVNAGRMQRGRDPDGDFDELALRLRSVTNVSRGDTERVVCEPSPTAALNDLVDQIAATWGVRTRTSVQLAAPLAQLVRELVDDDTEAQRRTVVSLLDPGAT